jgi:hypothetical protein
LTPSRGPHPFAFSVTTPAAQYFSIRISFTAQFGQSRRCARQAR